MGITRVSPEEIVALLSILEAREREEDEEAIRNVRERLTSHPAGDMGLLKALRPHEIARVLAGKVDDGVHLDELLLAHEYFVALGSRVRSFYNAFVVARNNAKRGTKRYIPDETTLRASFGDDWRLVLDAWPAIPFLVKVLEVRENRSLPERERDTSEEAYWMEAAMFLAYLHPNDMTLVDVVKFVQRKVSAMGQKTDDLPGYLQEVVTYVVADAEGLKKRMLVYDPQGRPDRVFRYWMKAIKNAARDLRASRVRLGVKGDEEVTRAPGTLRRWKHEAKQRAQPEGSRPQKSLVDIANEKTQRQKHRDPSGTYLTLTEVAEKLGVAESSVRNAVKRARAAGALVPQRQPNSRSYAFRPGVDEEIIARFLALLLDIASRQEWWTAGRAPRGTTEEWVS